MKKVKLLPTSKVVIVRGLPGSGKSTTAKYLVKIGYKHFEADMYFIQNGVYQFNPALLYQAHQWCQQFTREAIKQNYAVVVSNTFTTRKEVQPYIDMALELAVPYTIFVCKAQFKNIHNVPEQTLEKMKKRWQDIEGEYVLDEEVWGKIKVYK